MHKNKWVPRNLAENEAAVMEKVGTYAICNFLSNFFFFSSSVSFAERSMSTDISTCIFCSV